MKDRLFAFFTFSFISIFFILCKSNEDQYSSKILIPDKNFEERLIYLGIDKDGKINGEMDSDDAKDVKELSISHREITDLKGIEAFTNLEVLFCERNKLSYLSLNANTKLKQLDCAYNTLTTLDISKNSHLTRLACFSNQLSVLDISNNTKLEDLICSNNFLQMLEVSQNSELVYRQFNFNYLFQMQFYTL